MCKTEEKKDGTKLTCVVLRALRRKNFHKREPGWGSEKWSGPAHTDQTLRECLESEQVRAWEHKPRRQTGGVRSVTEERGARKTVIHHWSTSTQSRRVQWWSSLTTDYVEGAGGYHLLSLSPWGLSLIVDTTHSRKLRARAHARTRSRSHTHTLAHKQGCAAILVRTLHQTLFFDAERSRWLGPIYCPCERNFLAGDNRAGHWCGVSDISS